MMRKNTIKQTLNKIYEFETKEKYLNDTNNYATTYQDKDSYDYSNMGRNFILEAESKYRNDFQQRLYEPKYFSSSDSRMR